MAILASDCGEDEDLHILDTAHNTKSQLCYAAETGDAKRIEHLLSHGAEVNTADKYGSTPLHASAQNGHKEIVEFLLSHGAQVNTANKYGCTPLYAGASKGHKEIVELLLTRGAEVNRANKYGCTPLYAGVRNGHMEIVKLLLIHEAEVNTANNNGFTPIFAGALKGRKEIVELLLSYGAELKTKNNNGFTPLYAGAWNGHKEIVELLVSHGAEVNTADNDGGTPLYASACLGHKEIVELLLSHGAEVNTEDTYGSTPLHAGEENGHKEIVELLLSHGAKVNTADNNGCTPLNADVGNGYNKPVERVLRHGAEVNTAKNNGNTALYAGARSGNEEIVELLVSHGAEVNTTDNDGCSPLYTGEVNSNDKCITVLFEHGADFDPLDHSGATPRMLAMRKDHKDIVDIPRKAKPKQAGDREVLRAKQTDTNSSQVFSKTNKCCGRETDSTQEHRQDVNHSDTWMFNLLHWDGKTLTGWRLYFFLLLLPQVVSSLTCPQGEFLYQFYPGHHEEAMCKECPLETFMPYTDHKQTQCRTCEKVEDSSLEILVSPCNATHDAIIHCVDGYYRERARNPRENGTCQKCTNCSEFGYRASTGQSCSTYSDTICCPDENYDVVHYSNAVPVCRERPWFCRQGQYFDTRGYQCLPCPDKTFMHVNFHVHPECFKCKDYTTSEANSPLHSVIVQPCNSTHDAVLRCQDGFFIKYTMGPRSDATGCSPCTNCSTTNAPYEGRKCDSMKDTVCCSLPDMTVVDEPGGPVCETVVSVEVVTESSYKDDARKNLKNDADDDRDDGVDNGENGASLISNHKCAIYVLALIIFCVTA